MAFFDSYPQCAKCCCVVNLRTGALLLAVFSILIRVILFALAYPRFDHLPGDGELFLNEKNSILLEFFVNLVVAGVIGTIADILLILGIVRKVQKYVQVYLLMMFFVLLFEICFFLACFVLGYHWLDVSYSLILGLFHIWCWFIAHSLNQKWVAHMGPNINGHLDNFDSDS